MQSTDLSQMLDAVVLGGHSWAVFVVPSAQLMQTLGQLREEIQYLETSGVVRSGEFLDVNTLLAPDAPSSPVQEGVVVISGLETLGEEQLRQLDLSRARFAGFAMAIFFTTSAGLDALRTSAPHFWSWVSSNIWTYVAPEALDPERRLGELRSSYGLNDEDLVKMAAEGSIDLTSDIVEWLVLIGREDLLGD